MFEPLIWLALILCAFACAVLTNLILREAVIRSDDWIDNWQPEQEWLDPTSRLPLLWRLAWPAMRTFGPLGRLLLSNRAAVGAASLLSKASMPGMVRPEHLAVARLLCVLAFWVVLLIVGWVLLLTSDDVLRSICYLGLSAFLGPLVFIRVPDTWLHTRATWRRRAVERQLPFFLDLLALCVQAGMNVQGGLVQATLHGPRGVLREEIERVLSEIRAGQDRLAAFAAFARRSDSASVQAWVAAMAQAEALGMSLGDQLREQAAAQSAARFDRAEQRAMQAPVKMLLPLMVFIFPCTFVVIGFPIAMSMRGVFF